MKLTMFRAAGLLAGIGVLAAGGYAAANAGTTPATTPHVQASTTQSTGAAALDPAKLTYTHHSWTSIDATSESEWSTGLDVPKGWSDTKLGLDKHRFTSPDGVQSLRVDSWLKQQRSQSAAAEAKIASLKHAPGFHVVSLTKTAKSTTLTYTYRSTDGCTRMVLDRWLADLDSDAPHNAQNELAVSGHPQDQAGLSAVLARATKTFNRAG